MANAYYATREMVKAALDINETARKNSDVDRALDAASRSVEGLLLRKFYPQLATRYKDWPDLRGSRSYTLWLDEDELISISTLVAGGTTITSADYFLEPVNSGPPYDRIEIDLASTSSFASNSGTHQRSIVITGLFGYKNDHEDIGTLTAAVSSTTATTISISNSAIVGVGDVIHPDYGGSEVYEHMIVTDKVMADTGVNIDAADSLTASNADVSITCSTTTAAPMVGETILIDSERMLVVDKAGAVITVKRAYDGTVLAAHSANADIYAPRDLTVARGQVGTTAATHLINATMARHTYPGTVVELTLAYAINNLLNRSSGYAREGSGERGGPASGRGIAYLEEDALRAYGRYRTEVV